MEIRNLPWKAVEEDETHCASVENCGGEIIAILNAYNKQDNYKLALVMAAAPELHQALQAIFNGFVDGSIRFTKQRQADSDPHHPANVLMCAALDKASQPTESRRTEPRQIQKAASSSNAQVTQKPAVKHPLPWEVKMLMILDAHGEQVFHHGDARDRYGRMLDGDHIIALNHRIVNAVNDHAFLINILKSISALWPEDTSADILSVNGINDGRSRAIIADAAISIARDALSTVKQHTFNPQPNPATSQQTS